ncbi:MAG: hypothetical protein ACRCYQ_12480 [Nocardioides sp.]
MLYMDSAAERTLHDASERAVATCMSGRGFRYLAEPYPGIPTEPDVLSDTDRAAVAGYALPQRASPPSPNNEWLATLSKSEQVAWHESLLGRPAPPGFDKDASDSSRFVVIRIPGQGAMAYDPRSCDSIGQEKVRGNLRRWREHETVIEGMQREIYPRMRNDPRFISAEDRWRACMKRAGYDYEYPRAPVTEFSRKPGTEPSKEEIATAVADTRCYVASDLTQLRTRLLRQYEKEIAREKRPAIDRFRSMQRAALATAKRLLAKKQ